jgi:hypothetical protein
MAQLLFEKIQIVKKVIASLEGYDVMLLDTGAGIAETVLQFNLLAPRNIVVLNRELTSITDSYAMMKVMHQIFGRDAFSLIVNAVADDREGEKIFSHVDGICRRFLGFATDYLGPIYRDEAVPRSILRQEPLVLAGTGSRTAACFGHIAGVVSRWGGPCLRALPAAQTGPVARETLHEGTAAGSGFSPAAGGFFAGGPLPGPRTPNPDLPENIHGHFTKRASLGTKICLGFTEDFMKNARANSLTCAFCDAVRTLRPYGDRRVSAVDSSPTGASRSSTRSSTSWRRTTSRRSSRTSSSTKPSTG